jgi:hypothetical protein
MSDSLQITKLLVDLSTIYDPCGVGVWLLNAHKQWDGASAVDLIGAGRLDEVEAAVEQLTSGAFT